MADQDPTVVADVNPGVDPGSETEPTPGVAAVPAEPQSFYSYTHPDGRVDEYKTSDDVSAYIRKGTMRFEDYQSKMSDLTQRNDGLSGREKAIEAGAQTLLQRQQEYSTKNDELERVLRSMPRGEYDRLKQMISGGVEAQPQLPPEVLERIQKLEQSAEEGTKTQQQADQVRQREEIAKALAGEYEDYDAEGTEALLQELYQSPDGDALRSLYELAHWAGKGRQGVAGMQAEAVNRGAVRTGKQAPVKSPKGKAKGDNEVIVHKNFEEAEAAARAEG